jgi:endonuclease III
LIIQETRFKFAAAYHNKSSTANEHGTSISKVKPVAADHIVFLFNFLTSRFEQRYRDQFAAAALVCSAFPSRQEQGMSESSGPGEDPQKLARRVSRALKEAYPEATCALVHSGPYQLLVATILSAQCTDVRVNIVTPELFRRFPDPASLALAEPVEVESLIRSTGFFRAKARNLLAMASQVVQQHDGQIPRDLDALTQLAGVGRKTANVVLGTAFGIASGIVVDTHVKRLTRRMGLTTSKTPEHIERDLMRLIPRTQWVDFSHRLILHGRRVCLARRPRCDGCTLASFCPKTGVPLSRKTEGPDPPRNAKLKMSRPGSTT